MFVVAGRCKDGVAHVLLFDGRMSFVSALRWFSVPAITLLVACSSSSPPDATGATTSQGGGGALATGGGGAMATGGGGEAPDWTAAARCVDAPPFEVTPQGAGRGESTIRQPGERVHYKVSLPKLTWIALRVRKPDFSSLDAVIRVYDESGTTLLATVDEHRPAFPNFEAMYFATPYAGTFCVEVLTFEDWRGLSVEPAEHDFEVWLNNPEGWWGNIPNFRVRDTEPNDTTQEATPILSESGYVITGSFSSESDRDVYVMNNPQDTLARRYVISSPPGAGGDGHAGYGSSTALTAVSIVASDGVTVLARHDPNDLIRGCNPLGLCGSVIPLADITDPYYIVVERDPNVPLSDPETYSIFSVGADWGGSGYELEPSDDGTNDDRMGAMELSLLADVDGYPGYAVDASLADGDVDWYHIPELGPEEALGVWCSATQWGSGIDGLRVEAVDAADSGGSIVQSETETGQVPLQWDPGTDPKVRPSLPPLPGGRAYDIKVTADGWNPNVTSREYFCRFTIQPGGL